MLSIFVRYFKKYVITRERECLVELNLCFHGHLNIGSGGINTLLDNAIPAAQTVVSNLFNGGSEFKNFAASLFEKATSSVAGSLVPATTTTKLF
jgi:hypothetical protein